METLLARLEQLHDLKNDDNVDQDFNSQLLADIIDDVREGIEMGKRNEN